MKCSNHWSKFKCQIRPILKVLFFCFDFKIWRLSWQLSSDNHQTFRSDRPLLPMSYMDKKTKSCSITPYVIVESQKFRILDREALNSNLQMKINQIQGLAFLKTSITVLVVCLSKFRISTTKHQLLLLRRFSVFDWSFHKIISEDFAFSKRNVIYQIILYNIQMEFKILELCLI